MYTNITLYYLNQMQIRPWIKRCTSLALCLHQDTEQETVKLYVFISLNLSVKEKSLLQQIIRYINLLDHELRIIPTQENEFLTQYQTSISQKLPSAILIFGLNGNYIQEALNATCPISTCAALDYLLSNPSQKRKVFQEINALKQLLA